MTVSVRRCASFTTLVLGGALTAACTSWQPATIAPESLEGRDVTVYMDTTRIVLHGTRTSDTLLVGEERESGREMAIPVSEVDSVRVRRPNVARTFLTVVGTALGVITFIMLFDSPDSL